MRRPVAAAACALILALTAIGSASAATIGANDDTGKYSLDAGAVFFGQMSALGLKQSVMTTRFVPSDPTTVQDGAALDVAILVAQLAGLRVSLAVYPYPPREVEDGTATPAAFATWLTMVAQRYPTVKQYVVLNEPNQPAFLRPQFGATGVECSRQPAPARSSLPGTTPSRPSIPRSRSIGLGLSPRGNDRPTAPSNISTSPVRFLAALGAWYRKSGRTLPLMDGLSFHPYPNQATDPLDRGYNWPNAGFANLDRIKQAVWDAFRGTDQPTTVTGLKLYLDEVGWQVDTSNLLGYTGTENVRVTNDTHQAAVYADLVRQSACDPVIAEVNIFGFYDDAPRDNGFQAALFRIDGTPRASASSVQAAIEVAANGCAAKMVTWSPARRVVGAAVSDWKIVKRQDISVTATAGEGAYVVACLLPGRFGGIAAAAQLTKLTASSRGCTGRTMVPLRPVTLAFRRTLPLSPATVGIKIVAETSPDRVRTFSRTLR